MDGLTQAQSYTFGNEGCRLESYQDTLGIWTIGVGHCGPEVAEGLCWTQDQVDSKFVTDYTNAAAGAAHVIGPDYWAALDPVRQAAIIDVVFNLGVYGFSQFKMTIAAIRAGAWQGAHDGLIASAYAKQLPGRAGRNASMILTGDWATAEPQSA